MPKISKLPANAGINKLMNQTPNVTVSTPNELPAYANRVVATVPLMPNSAKQSLE